MIKLFTPPTHVVALILVFFYAALGSYGLLNNNEGLYAEIAWEMVESGDWILPHLNGVPYIEKPPLLYWLMALSFTVFGKSALAARLVPATFGVMTCLSLLWFGTILGRQRMGRIAALILASSVGFIVFSRMVFFDGGLTLFLTLSALFFYRFFETKDLRYVRFFYGALALGVLIKGLVILVLMGLIILIFCAVSRQLSFLLRLFDLGGILIFLGVTVPWHVAACLRDPGFAWFYFVNEHVMRFLDQRIPRDYYRGPWYYYIPRFLGSMIPWTFLMSFLKPKKVEGSPSLKIFLGVWFLVLFIFFSVSRAKANYYMMVAMPPAALCLAMGMNSWKHWKMWLGIGVGFSLVLMIGGVVYMHKNESRFSMGPTVETLNLSNKNVYLYRRFEELSSLAFYVGHPIPIIDCESHDLWYGKKKGLHPDLFLSPHDVKADTTIIVTPRDVDDFEQVFKGQFIEKSVCPCIQGPYKIYNIT